MQTPILPKHKQIGKKENIYAGFLKITNAWVPYHVQAGRTKIQLKISVLLIFFCVYIMLHFNVTLLS